MGNQQSIASSQLFSVERYLSEHPEYKFSASLGSTRFLKVARAESQEGPVVVKVFATNDNYLDLESHRVFLEYVRKKLASAVNCIPFQKILVVSNKNALLIREYVKYSLYDRISTRPFLTNIEKRWITFQILYALYQCHKVGICHGDIKLENIMVTSWNWVLLVDFASVKRSYLCIDNPTEYSYFFDTSRRRMCYIAPERFTTTTATTSTTITSSPLLSSVSTETTTSTSTATTAKSESNSVLHDYKCEAHLLTPGMDIFSAGCAMLELWNELHVPFDYSQVLLYRFGKYSPQKHLDTLEDPSLKSLISSMIELDPHERQSAENYLDQERGKFFPEYFYSFLQSYMLIFSSSPALTPDEKICRLKNDIGNIFKFLGPIKVDESVEKGNKECVGRSECEGLVIITSLVTSCIRGLHDCSSKLYALEILLELANHASDETILDRILPYVMYLAQNDHATQVKISAINTTTKCLDLVKKIPRSDANIFPEYILPGLAPLATDPNMCVRVAYARNIATLADIALRYLEQTQSDWYENNNDSQQKDEYTFNYELELQALHEMIQQTVSAILTDTSAVVKQTLMESGITKLCVFFGKYKANDVLLSHIITFLNDKEDKELRGSFFDSIVGVAAYIGWHCSEILKPLLLQGLTDSSEFVIMKCIKSMSALAELGLLSKPALCDLVTECSYFLVHPNLWIRQAVAGFISTAAKTLNILHVQCKIMPHLECYMKYSLIQIDQPELLLESLVSPIPRKVYDIVVAYPEINSMMQIFEQRKKFRESIKAGSIPERYEITQGLKTLVARLVANGMTENMEDYILNMAHHLKKINKHKSNMDSLKQNDGRIEISTTTSAVKSQVFNFSESQKVFATNRNLHGTNTSSSIDTNINSDWNYSSDVLTRQSESTNSGGPPSRSTSSRPSSPSTDMHNQFLSGDPSTHMSLYVQYKRSRCSVELSNLKIRQQDHYFEALRNKEYAEQTAWQPQLPPPGWKFRNTLVAHLYEHRSAVNKLCTLPDSPFFASCSLDGTVRLWDCSRIEGKTIANRARQHYRMSNNSSVLGMAVCESGQSLGTVCQDGSVNILRLDTASNKMNLVQSRQLNSEEDGFAVEVQCLDSGSQSVLVYATLYGSLVGWDLRAPGTAWRLENGVRQGVITTFCIDTQQSWLCLGTNSGYHIAWDLRFQLPITTIEYQSANAGSVRIRKITSHPTEHSWIMSSVQGNNEISMWNLETGSRQKVLWGSITPPLSKSQGSSHSICAMLAGCIDRSPFLYTGGTDQRIRFWDLENPSNSQLAIPAASDLPGTNLSFKSRLIDGTSVIYEEANVRVKDRGEEVPRAGPEPPLAGHRDSISDITLCKAAQCYLITSSREGVIKVWK